jgi:hypothetical protein
LEVDSRRKGQRMKRKASFGIELAGLVPGIAVLLGLLIGGMAKAVEPLGLIGQLPASRSVYVSLPPQDNGWNGPTIACNTDVCNDALSGMHKVGTLACNPGSGRSGVVRVLLVQSGGYYAVTCWEADYLATPTPAPTEGAAPACGDDPNYWTSCPPTREPKP